MYGGSIGDAKEQIASLLEEDTRIIVTSNHSYFLDQNLVDTAFQRDPRLAAATKNAFILAKPELFKGRKRFFFDAVNAVPVFRDGEASDEELFDLTKRFMSVVPNRIFADENMVTFPEGTRNKGSSNKLQEVKDGAAGVALKIAKTRAVAVVAVGICYPPDNTKFIDRRGASLYKFNDRRKASLYVCQPDIVDPSMHKKELAVTLESTQARALHGAVQMEAVSRKI